ncbi:hypothetical protein SNEBB_009937 [Seison nebaliae]|nr:hypothetical protein SNEBB_009937 [Seison nebaliae]
MSKIDYTSFLVPPMVAIAFKDCWDLCTECLNSTDYIFRLFERHYCTDEYKLLCEIIGNGKEEFKLDSNLVVQLFLNLKASPRMEPIYIVLNRVIDYLNKPNSSKKKQDVAKLFFETNESRILYGTLEPNDDLETKLHLNKYMKVTGYLRSVGERDILSQLSKNEIKVKQISRVDKHEDMSKMTSRYAIFILTLNGLEFDKAFNEHVWHKNTSAQYYHCNKDTTKFLKDRCTIVFPRPAVNR